MVHNIVESMDVLESSLQLSEARLDIRTHVPQTLNQVSELRWREAVLEYCSGKFQGFLVSG